MNDQGKVKIRLSVADILFENSDYIAIDKKAGWVVHKTRDPNRTNLFDALKSFLKNRDRLNEEPYLSLHHRLDVETSGIIIFGKSKRSNKILADLFLERKAIKKYRAICFSPSFPIEKIGVMEDFLKKEKDGKIEKMIPVQSGGKKTITSYHLIESSNNLHLMEFELVTGRMHQIRVQSAIRKLPIVGDLLYGDQDTNKKMKVEGQLLHAYSFSFFDPLSESQITIESKVPFNFKNLNRGHKGSEEKIIILFNKPYNVLCQFTKEKEEEKALCDFNLPSDVYPAGRLDKDSEGLLLLTNDGELNHRLASPKYDKEKVYWVQVENIPSADKISELNNGVVIKGGYKTLPCKVRILENLKIPDRIPPIRERKNIPTCWLEIIIVEGKNRQVRRMTAAIGHPTLRLIRKSIGDYYLSDEIESGEYIILPTS